MITVTILQAPAALQALALLQALAGMYVIAKGLNALNRMSSRTAHGIRLAYLVLTTGAVAVVTSSLGSGNIFECFFAVGAALYLALDRRNQRRANHGR